MDDDLVSKRAVEIFADVKQRARKQLGPSASEQDVRDLAVAILEAKNLEAKSQLIESIQAVRARIAILGNAKAGKGKWIQ